MKNLYLLIFAISMVTGVVFAQTAGSGFDLRDPSIDLTTEEVNAIAVKIAGSTTGIDFDNDGKFEFVTRADNTADSDCQLRVYEYSADNTLAEQGSGVKIAVTTRQTGYIRGLLVANVDGDAANEVLVSYEGSNGSERIAVYDVNSSFAFSLVDTVITGDDPVGIGYAGDTDSDGNPEFIFANIAAAANVRAVEWDGSGWTIISTTVVTGGGQSLDMGNTDGDANKEIFILRDNSGTAELVGLQYATGAFSADATISNNVAANASTKTHTHVKIADLDGDSDNEVIVVVNDNDGTGAGTTRALYVFENTGSSNYDRDETAATGLFSQADRITAIEVGDADADGSPELYYSLEATGSGSVLFREHTGSANAFATADFGSATTMVSSMGTNVEAGAIGFGVGSSFQLDGDTYRDIVVATMTTTTKDIYTLESTTGDAGLPVELSHFTATRNGNGVTVVWSTATEQNNLGFEVQRSVAGGSFSKIAFVEGHGTTNAPQSYSYVDASAAAKASYRLKQIDRDGKFTYSQTVEVNNAGTVASYGLGQNYPNPFNPATTISFALPVAGQVSLKVYDMLGKEVATLVNGVRPAGENHASFNAATLPSGMYFYTLRSASFSATKKMMLVK